MQLIYQYVKKHGIGFLIGIIFLTVEAICDLLQPTMMSKIIDDAVATRSINQVFYYGGIMLIIAVIGAVSAVVRNFCASNISQSIGKEMRFNLYKKIQSFSLENIDRLETPALMTRLTSDVTQIQNFINGCMRILVKAPILCIGAIMFIVFQTPRQIPIMLGVISTSFLLIILNMKYGYPRFAKVQQKLDKLNKVTREYLSLMRVVKAFGQQRYEQKRFNEVADELADANISAMKVNAFFSPLISVSVNIGIVMILWLGGYGGNGIQIGKLMESINYMIQILFALGMISMILNSMVRASASARRVQEVFDEENTLIEPKTEANFDLRNGITFRNVTFYYPNAKSPVLKNISFTLKKGMTCGIIGSTGSGKSTLVQLLMHFYDISEGSIMIGSCDISNLQSHKLREKIAFVSQKPILFTGTIEENLRWGNKMADLNMLEQALEVADAKRFVSHLKEGYQTQLGHGGVNLSGGQKQRLSIARALVKNPEILILDDCTSSLDATTEGRVLNGIKHYTKDLTTFIISQRIASVMMADYILCLEDGEVAGFDSHQALMENCRVYQEIYVSQIGGPENE